MKLLRSFGKQKRRKLLNVRRVAGNSMLPALHAGQYILTWAYPKDLHVGDVVVVSHAGLDKVKRITEIDPRRGVFIRGDNPNMSTDSRTFGWIDFDEIVAKVIWPRM